MMMESPCVVAMNPRIPSFNNHSTIPNNTVNSSPFVATDKMSSMNNARTTYDQYGLSPNTNEIMRGQVTLLSSSHGPQRVILSVFRTSVDHFALVYPDNR